MALESFGTEIAKMVNHAAILCHDMIKEDDGSFPYEFEAGQHHVWKVERGVWDDDDKEPCIVIKLGVG